MKSSFSISTTVFAILAFLVSCGGSEGISEPGSIYGVVSDKATGEPIKNAGVELLPVGLKTVTGSDGSFEFLDVSHGQYNLLVTKTGYRETKSSTITVESGKAARQDIQLEKLPAALRIVDDARKDISELDFGDRLDDVSRSFNIFNDSPNSFEWKITKTAEWITSISQVSGKLAAGDTQGIIVEIDRSLLREGENISQLHITAVNNGDKRLTIKATDSDVCKNNPCGEHGTCKATRVKAYECKCAEGYFSNEIECVNPCADEPCVGVENSTGKCAAQDAFSYSCECKDTFSWNGSNCLNPCDPNPCIGLEHSTEICNKVDKFTNYTCECLDTFMWNGIECLNPCEPNPCAGIENSTEICDKVDDFTQYSCGCIEGFIWNGENCLNPCLPNPCSDENSTGKCVARDAYNYSCECKMNYIWDDSFCVFPECGPDGIMPCVDLRIGLIWSTKTSVKINWESANNYCRELNEGNFTDWRLPNIDELRTLIKGRKTMSGGACNVSETHDCLSDKCWNCIECAEACSECDGSWSNCEKFDDGRYSILGDTCTLWSSSLDSEATEYAWIVGFSYGSLAAFGKDGFLNVRCVRNQ